MEHCCEKNICDYNNYRYVGWNGTIANTKGCGNLLYNQLFTQKNIDMISNKISELLEGVDPEGNRLYASDEKICSVISSIVFESPSHMTGNGIGRYLTPINVSNDLSNVNLRVINAIVNSVKDHYVTIENNKKLSIWTSVYGDFNKHGLRSHPEIKIKEKHPQYMMFNMNY